MCLHMLVAQVEVSVCLPVVFLTSRRLWIAKVLMTQIVQGRASTAQRVQQYIKWQVVL